MGVYIIDSKEQVIEALELILKQAKKDSYTIDDIAFDLNELSMVI